MKKIIPAGLICAVLLCGCSAQNHVEESAEYQLQIEELPKMQQIETELYLRNTSAYQGILRASREYEMLLPYCQSVTQADGSTVERYALADQSGTVVTDAIYDSVSLETIGNHEIYVLTTERKGQNQVTCAPLDGSWVIGPFYGSAEVTEEGIITREYTEDGTWRGSHLFDRAGKNKLNTRNEILDCQDGTILCREDGAQDQYVWLTLDGTELAAFQAKYVGMMGDGFVLIQTDEGYGVLDEDGEWAIQPVYQSLGEQFGDYIAAQDANGTYGILNLDGDIVQEFIYTKIRLCDNTVPLYQLWTEEESMVVNVANNKRYAVPSGITTEEIIGLHQPGHAVQTGDAMIVFDDLVSFEVEGGSALYEVGEKTIVVQGETELYLINLEAGTKSKAISYVYCEPGITDSLQSNTFVVCDPRTGRQGVLSESGKIVLQPIYQQVNVITDGYYQVKTAQFTGVIDRNGEWVIRLRNTAD